MRGQKVFCPSSMIINEFNKIYGGNKGSVKIENLAENDLINIDDINPIEIKDLKPGDYIILRVQYDSTKFDYKLAYVDSIRDGQVKFNIQSINILRTPIKITDFCILPSYSSNNFYKQNNK